MAKEFDILQQASEIAEQAWNRWEEVNRMVALRELEVLLNRATPSALEAEVVQGRTVPVATIGESVDLVYGVFSYSRRAIGVPGRLLTTEITHQPVLAVKEGNSVTPLAYAEDVVAHPLSTSLIGFLEALRTR